MPRNWRTTLAGLAAALGTAAQAVPDPTLRAVGLIVAVLALVALGLFAGDAAPQEVQRAPAASPSLPPSQSPPTAPPAPPDV